MRYKDTAETVARRHAADAMLYAGTPAKCIAAELATSPKYVYQRAEYIGLRLRYVTDAEYRRIMDERQGRRAAA